MGAEIRAKLRVEDGGSSETLARIRDGFRGVRLESNAAAAGAVGFAKQAAASALGMNLPGLISGAKSVATEWIHAAAGPAAVRQQFASMGMLLNDLPMEAAGRDADRLLGSFRDLGLETGIAGSEIRGAYQVISEMGKGTAEDVRRAQKEVGQLAKVSAVLQTPLEGAAREVEFMEQGMLRTRGHMFQLLNRTGIFGNDIKKAAQSWQQLTQEERSRRLALALDQTAGKIGKLPMTWERVTGQIDNLADGWKKDFGGPLIEALIPELERATQLISFGRGELKLFAKTMGQDVGRWVHDAASLVEKGFGYVRSHQQEIRGALAEGADKTKAVVEFAIAHRKDIAAAMVIAKVSPYAAGAAELAPGMARGALALGRGAVGFLPNAIMGLVDSTKAGVGPTQLLSRELTALRGTINASVSPTVAMTAALAASYLAWDQMTKLLSENRYLVQSLGSAIGALFGTMRYMSTDELENQAAKLEELRRQNEALRKSTGAQMLHLQTSQGAAQYQLDPTGGQGTKMLVDAYNAAIESKNDAEAKYAAQAILSTNLTVDYLKKAGFTFAGGLDEFQNIVGQSADPAKMKRFLGAFADWKSPKLAVTNNFPGAKFDLHQDFRDQDPDRVAYVFEEMLGRQVTRRIGSNTSTPFGT